MRYRRADVTGGTYFFPVNLAERKRTLLVEHIDVLRMVMKNVKVMHPFRIGDLARSLACTLGVNRGRTLSYPLENDLINNEIKLN